MRVIAKPEVIHFDSGLWISHEISKIIETII